MRGKAIEAGAEGDIINVINLQSKRTVQGIVTGPGRVHRRRRPPRRRRQPSQCARREPQALSRVSVMSSSNRRLRLLAAAARWRSPLRRRLLVARPPHARSARQPPLSAIDNPTAQPGYKPVQMPMPTPQPASYSPNSLWRNGSRAFFKDQRAHQIGDILTVKVKITDKAKIDNETKRSRTNKEDFGVTDFFGSRSCSTGTRGAGHARQDPHRRLDRASSEGKGSVNRTEDAARPTSPASSRRCCRTAIS